MAGRCTIAFRFATTVLCGLLTFCARPAAAQTWEYSPYNIRLCVVVEATPNTAGLAEQLGRDVAASSRLATGVVWRIFPEQAPAALQVDLLTRLESLSPDELRTLWPEASRIDPLAFPRNYVAATGDGEKLTADKLVFVIVHDTAAGYQIQVRELDVASRQWGEVFTATAGQFEAVPGVALASVLRAVRPLAKVERVAARSVIARLRASGLITRPNSPAAIEAGQVMTPIVRRNGRNGEPLPNGIAAPPWSYVAIDSRTDTAVRGTISSGFGSVIPAKAGAKTDRLLLGLTPHFATTRLELKSRVPATGKGPAPPGRALSGYEVYVKNLGEEKTELLGLTDWEGGLELKPGEKPLRLFYIKNGGQLLARLPLVVGQQPEMVAYVLDDDPRLAAEAYIKSLQSRVMDLVARREILAVRIRSKVKKGDFAGAKQLVAEYRTLPNSVPLIRELEATQRRMTNTPGVTGKRIEKLFLDAQKLLQGFLDPATADKLAGEVAEAEKKGPPTTPTTPATTPTTPATTTTPAAPAT